MPVKCCGIIQIIFNIHMHHISFFNEQGRTPEFTVYTSGNSLVSLAHNLREGIFDIQVKIGPRKRVGYP